MEHPIFLVLVAIWLILADDVEDADWASVGSAVIVIIAGIMVLYT